MGSLLRILGLRPILRPIVRVVVGMIAIPLFRLFLTRVARTRQLDEELQNDLEQWFRASLVLLAATKNLEDAMFGWVPPQFDAIGVGLRLLLVIGVIEGMPDQQLFSIIHPGPPRLKFDRSRPWWPQIRIQSRPFLKGLASQHINRSSPVFALLAAIYGGPIGWTCYFVAITQYLIIGLVTSKDKALDALSEFDRQVAIRRQELVDESGPPSDQPRTDNAQATISAEPSADSSDKSVGDGRNEDLEETSSRDGRSPTASSRQEESSLRSGH